MYNHLALNDGESKPCAFYGVLCLAQFIAL